MKKIFGGSTCRPRRRKPGWTIGLGLALIFAVFAVGAGSGFGRSLSPRTTGSADGQEAAAAISGVARLVVPFGHISRLNPFASLYQEIIDRSVRAGLVGLAVYIETLEEGVWMGTGGYADLETRTRISPDNLFYSASHLKIFTATAMMMLWDAGLVDLDTPIDRYLPASISSRLANAGTATIRNLLSHTSGIPTYWLASPWENDPMRTTWRDDIEAVLGKPADFAPGTKFQYCNTNFLLAAVIIDQITGDHAQFLSRNIFQPLGMTRTFYRHEPGLPRPPGLLTPYLDRYEDGSLESVGENFPEIRQNHAYGAGGLLAELGDYARFSEALFGGELISLEALRIMSTPDGPGALYGYGLGMIIHPTSGVNEAKYGKCHGHGGRGYFGVLEMNRYPKAGVTIGYASNTGSMGEANVFDELERQFGDAVFNRRARAVPTTGTPEKSSAGRKSVRKESR